MKGAMHAMSVIPAKFTRLTESVISYREFVLVEKGNIPQTAWFMR